MNVAAAESAWNGGGSPYAVNSKKFGMWLFIASDALTFTALLMAWSIWYGVRGFRRSEEWGPYLREAR